MHTGIQLPYTRIFSSDKNFEELNYVGIFFVDLGPRAN